jgi:hypothetical protein
MIVSSETKQAIVDSLAAIDLMTELLEEQRRMLEAALQPDQRPIEIGARPSEDGHRRHHHKGPPTTLNIRIDGHTISESQAAVGMVKAIGVICSTTRLCQPEYPAPFRASANCRSDVVPIR